MSRLKKSSGKEYQRLSQTADSDDEVILYSLSPSSAAAFHPTSPAATTEFGSGHYDRDLDLELPTPPPTSGRLLQVSPSKRRRGGGTAGTKVRTSRWRRRSSREARACCGFLLLGAVAVAVILLASSKLSLSNWTHHSQQASSSSSITATEAPSTPTPAATTNRLRASSTHHLSPHLSPHLSTHLSTHPHHLPPTPAPIPPAEPSTTPSSHTSQGDETTSAVVSMSLANSSEETAASTATPSGSPSQSPSPPSPSDTQQEGGGGGEGEGSGSTPSQSPSPPTTSDTQQEGEGGGGGEGEGSGSTPSQSPSPPTTSDTQQEGEGGGGGEGEGSGSTSSQSSATPSPPTTSDTQQEGGGGGISWKREFFPALTETALQLQDMNGDGVRDVVMVEGRGECDSVIHALDGLTGETVWQAHVTYDAFAVKCDVDLNKDDIIDCIAAGRQSGFRALSGSDGTTIWDRDPNLPYLRYNFYYPLFVADMDGDGVQDIVNAHGGDTTYTERNVERSPGFMVVLSGRTGEQLMERVPVPDGHETYMSPILLTRGGGDERDMILVGTGGETLPGSLWAISHDSLHRRVIRYMSTRTSKDYTLFTGYVNHPCDKRDMSVEQLEALRPVFDPRSFNTSHDAHEDMYLTSCPPWGSHQPVWNEFGLCVYQLVSCWEKGVILPPVVVDMTGDMQDDLVVSAFEGRTLVIDGESGEIVWEVDNPGTESYSVPAPLYFNTDATPDLLVRINYGVWDTYNHSTITILDGQNGDILWSLNSTKAGMVSSLSLATSHSGGDAAVFVAVGTVDEEETPVVKKVLEGVGRRREDRHQMVGEAEEDVMLHGDPNDDPAATESDTGDDYEDFMSQAMAYRDPPGLWEGAGTEFPDPLSDWASFLAYCGWSERELTASLYLVTREMTANGSTLPPLSSHLPFIYFPGSEERRHVGQGQGDTAPRSQQCSHVTVPDMIVSTPVIGDVDGDGRLEMAYVVAWEGSTHESHVPLRFTVYVETLDKMLEEAWGEGEGGRWVQGALPEGQQPWTRYMGAHGDNIYHRKAP